MALGFNKGLFSCTALWRRHRLIPGPWVGCHGNDCRVTNKAVLCFLSRTRYKLEARGRKRKRRKKQSQRQHQKERDGKKRIEIPSINRGPERKHKKKNGVLFGRKQISDRVRQEKGKKCVFFEALLSFSKREGGKPIPKGPLCTSQPSTGFFLSYLIV